MEILDYVYTHKFLARVTTRRGTGGSGLGLSIVYNLVTGTLKGNITADSEEGKGTSFRIVFPKKG